MAAALTAHDADLTTLVVEKARMYGGSTGISGGGIWIPNNPTLRAAGQCDSRASIRRYLDLLTEGKVAPECLDAYVDHGPAAMELLGRAGGGDWPRRVRLRPLLRRPHAAQPQPRRHRPGAVLGGPDRDR